MDAISINSIAYIDTNILNIKTGNTKAMLKKDVAYNKKNVYRSCFFM